MDFLRFLDERERTDRVIREARRHQELLLQIVKGALAASSRYDEKKLFPEHFESDPNQQWGFLPATSDADVDMDYSGVEWSTPDADEVVMLQQLLGNNVVTVANDDLAPSAAPDVQPAVSEETSRIEQIDNNREWV